MTTGRTRGTGRTAAPQIFEAPVDVKDGRGQFLKRPAMTTAFRNAILNPRAGMGIFNTDTLQEEFYDGTIWKQSAGGGGPTLMVAASNALASTIARADYQCDGVADEVEIIAALTACNAGPGGRVLLSEGTFTLATPIIFPGNDLTLFGMGYNSFIDGDGLLTGNHAIQLVGRTNCTIEDLSIQTEDGGTKTCHCIFANDGCNYLAIDGVTIVNSDSDGIHIEGTNTTDVTIRNCSVVAVDEYAIWVDMDAANTLLRLKVINNTIQAPGTDGIRIALTGAGCNYSEIRGNNINGCGALGIHLDEFSYGTIADNTVSGCTAQGIMIANTSLEVAITGNHCSDNGGTNIRVGGGGACTSISIVGNTCLNNTANDSIYITGGCSYCTVSGNTIEGSAEAGIYIEASDNCGITGNTIFNTTHSGIIIDDSHTCVISGNVVREADSAGTTYNGISVYTSNHVTITGNTLDSNGLHGIYVYRSSHCSIGNNNCIDQNTGDGIHLIGDGVVNCDYNNVSNNVSTGNAGSGIELIGGANAIRNTIAYNEVIANGAANIIDNGTNTILKHNEGFVSGDEATVTITVAAAASLQTGNADFQCDGVDDDVQINAALAALPPTAGRVVLLEGIYVISAPIVLDDDAVTLEGAGVATLINGDGLATGEHAIVISGTDTYCTVRNLSVMTEDGGGKVSHCIFIEDGASLTTIDHVTIVNSDSDGIHIEGTNTTDITIENCLIEAADGNGIFVDMDAANTLSRLHIINNTIHDVGTDGIATGITGAGCTYAEIIGNIIASSGGRGMYLRELTYSLINDNIVHTSGGTGILIGTSSTNNVIDSNECYNNGQQGIEVNGNATDNTVSGNACHGNTACGIEFTGASHRCTAVGNNCRTNQYGIYFESSDYGVMTGNTVSDNIEDGLYFDSSDYGTCTGNVSYDNDVGGTEYNGIWVENSNYCVISANVFEGNGLHGIWIDRSDNCTVSGNICNNSNTGDGININGTAAYNTIADNECYGNASDGIEIVGGTDAVGNHITGNMIVENQNHGINCAGYKNKIEDNFMRRNGLAAAGTYHGIYLAATADGCQVNDNTVYGAGDTTEDGIQLADGCVSCQINGNYLYNTMGHGIQLVDNNHNTQVNNNHIQGVDDTGIEVLGSDYCTVNGNIVAGSGSHNINITTTCRYCTVNDNNCTAAGAANIRLAGTCDYCNIVGNNCTEATETGIIVSGQSQFATITGNNCHNNVQAGFYIEQSNNATVAGNSCSGNAAGIMLDNSHDCAVTGNVSSDNDSGGNTYCGIDLNASQRCTITGNTCDSNGLHGIHIEKCDYATITGNSCNNSNTGDGIHIEGTADRNADYNTISSNSCTGNASDGVEIAVAAPGQANKNIVIGNQLLGNGANPLVDAGTATETGHNIVA